MHTARVKTFTDETVSNWNGFNYSHVRVIKLNLSTLVADVLTESYECNCSSFKTEKEVKEFINEIAA